MTRRRRVTPEEAAAHKRHYLGLPTSDMADLRDDLISGNGNVDLLAALQEELTTRIAAAQAVRGALSASEVSP